MFLAAKDVRLWHLPSSHFSEKVRWALDHKRIAHVRRTPLIVPHFAVAFALTRGAHATFPVLELRGRAIGDSPACLAALEAAFPDPPLYPVGDADRERALELERWFDAELGPAVRLLALHEVIHDPPARGQLASRHTPAYMRPFPDAWSKSFGAFLRRRYGLDEPGGADRARDAIGREFDRLEQELGEREYLVGDAFSVADLAAASHFYWPIQPAEGPRIVERLPPPLDGFMEQFRDRRGYRWVLEMYRRHRRPSRPPAQAATDDRLLYAR